MSGNPRPAVFRCGKYCLEIGRKTYVCGILNTTPDSFSDGGRYADPDAALDHAAEMIRQGADMIDIGGESTRPGFDSVDDDIEISRVVPVIERISARFDCPISIDTTKPSVARAAIEAGACIINDVNGLATAPELAEVARLNNAGLILMYNGRLDTTSPEPDQDIMSRMRKFLSNSLFVALEAGIDREQLMLDPGIGFGVSHKASIAMVSRLAELKAFGLPIFIGPSRKRFITDILGDTGDRDIGTLGVVAIGIANGADVVRVHKVGSAVEVARISDALTRNFSGKHGGLLD